MEWIADHIQILFLIAIAVTAILQRLKKATEGQELQRPASAVSEEEERTRRIQAEIRRRIMERRGLAPAAPPAGEGDAEPRPFPAAPPMIEEIRPVRVEPPPVAAAQPGVDRAAEFRRQQEMIERARALETARRSRVEKAATASAAIAVAEGPDRRIPDLRSRPGLRRAVILREILGPPIGLR